MEKKLENYMETRIVGVHRVSGFPTIRGSLCGVPVIRINVFWGLYRGPPIYGNYYIPARYRNTPAAYACDAAARVAANAALARGDDKHPDECYVRNVGGGSIRGRPRTKDALSSP